MSGDTLAALRKAAAILLDAAPMPVVQATLRTLLAGTEAADQSLPRPAPTVRPRGRGRPAGAKTPASSAAWLSLRGRVRATMKRRDLGAEALARELGVSPTTLTNQLARRVPLSSTLARRLKAWVEQQPAQGVAEIPFRRSRAANGAGRHEPTKPDAGASRRRRLTR